MTLGFFFQAMGVVICLSAGLLAALKFVTWALGEALKHACLYQEFARFLMARGRARRAQQIEESRR